jgi:small subunit ribosomal protein S20
MANNKSAIKRIRVNERNRLENYIYKGKIKTIVKNYLNQLSNFKLSQDPNKNKLAKILNVAYSLIDKGVKKNIIHKKKAARKKSQLLLDFKTI